MYLRFLSSARGLWPALDLLLTIVAASGNFSLQLFPLVTFYLLPLFVSLLPLFEVQRFCNISIITFL